MAMKASQSRCPLGLQKISLPQRAEFSNCG